jgi:hypothetical protein
LRFSLSLEGWHIEMFCNEEEGKKWQLKVGKMGCISSELAALLANPESQYFQSQLALSLCSTLQSV